MRRVFVDTGAFVALRNASEHEHELARATLRDLLKKPVALYTSNYVFAETYTALLVRVGRSEANKWGTAFRSGSAIEMIRADEALEDRAWEILATHADRRWSYVDATSFALMEREGHDEAFAFDRSFGQRGLTLHPY